MDEQQLKWIQQNRTRKTRATAVGKVARAILNSPCVNGPAWRRGLLAVLTEHAGTELLEYATPVSIQAGVLSFEVCEPTVLYHLRVHWEQRLLKVLQSQLPAAGINAIRFRCKSRA